MVKNFTILWHVTQWFWSLQRIGVVKENHKGRENQIRGILVGTQSSDLKGPVNKSHPVEYVRGMDDY